MRSLVLTMIVASLVAGCYSPSTVSFGTGATASAPTASPPPILAEPTPTPAPTEPTPVQTAAFPTLPPFPGPPTLDVGGTQVEPSDQGGCATVLYLARGYAADQCGPHTFKLDAATETVVAGQSMTLRAPTGWSFSADAIAGVEAPADRAAWRVTVAPIAALVDLGPDQQELIPLIAGGRVLAESNEPASVVTVVAPTEPGEYLLQLGEDDFRDGWTILGTLWFWRISVE